MRPIAWMGAGIASLLLLTLLWVPIDRQELPQLAWFFGRLHPMLLHLPIGCLSALLLLEGLRGLRRSPGSNLACRALLWLAALTAVLSVVAGAVLETEGGYDSELLGWHRWLGGLTAVASLWLLVLRPAMRGEQRLGSGPAYGLLLLLTVGAMVGAGHYGASLTHGSTYLTQFAFFLSSEEETEPQPEQHAASDTEADATLALDDLELFAHVVQPIFERSCIECHGPEKQKVKLRLDGYAEVMKGSVVGPVVEPGSAPGSSLAEVLLLPESDEMHMPPEGKQPLSPHEIEAVLWWIEQGAPEATTLAELPRSPRMQQSLEQLRDAGLIRKPPMDAAATEPGANETAADSEPEANKAAAKNEPTSAKSEPDPLVEVPTPEADDELVQGAGQDHYETQIAPILEEYCVMCHGERKQKAGIRLDDLDPDMLAGSDAPTWDLVLDMIQAGTMPPERADPLTDEERRRLEAWLSESLAAAAEARKGEITPVLRRLTKRQYTNTLQDLLGVSVDFGHVLPDDGLSEMGFSNNGEVLQASPLHLDYYHAIAREALNQAIVVGERPPITHYRIRFGKQLGKGKVAARIGGYQSVPLAPDDFVVDILDSAGRPREGANEEEQAALDAIKRKIGIGLRGSSHERFRSVDEGMILYSALPHKEKPPKSWQGPSPNLKIEMQRCFPEKGDFVLRVRASRGYIPPTQTQLLVALDEPVALTTLDAEGQPFAHVEGATVLAAKQSDQHKNLVWDEQLLHPEDRTQASSARIQVSFPADGYYQVDLVHPVLSMDAMPSVRLSLGNRNLDLRPEAEPGAEGRMVTPLGVVGVRAGKHALKLGGPFFVGFEHLVVSPLPEDHPMVRRLTAEVEELTASLEGKTPRLRAFVGTRLDDGMDYKTFGRVVEVGAPMGAARDYEIYGRLENLPIPEPESGDKEVLSGIMLLGIWNDHLVKSREEPGPPLLIEAMEFEAPYSESWPPASHAAIFIDSERNGDEESYTRWILKAFMERAFRRPLEAGELDPYLRFWQGIRNDYEHYEYSIREVLVAVLCSPKFLYLAEQEASEWDEDVQQEAELASRLSYFLWNSPPDPELSLLARRGRLSRELPAQVDRMLDDPRSWRFVRAFAREWLRLDRLENMTINVDRHPSFTRFVKEDMAEETYHFFHHVLVEDLSVLNFIESDFALLNQNLAEFYGIPGVSGAEFRPVSLRREQGRGGLLSQGAFLSGHSDGNQAHPIKRAVWLKRQILGDPPAEPPPNVPDLEPQKPGEEPLSLKQQLELHRDKPSCLDCHKRIDPFGVAFERYNAVGLYQEEWNGQTIDTRVTLPDGTQVDGVAELKQYLLSDKKDEFTGALIKHLFAYALGRDLSFADEPELEQLREQVAADGYGMQAVIRAIVTSPSFLQN